MSQQQRISTGNRQADEVLSGGFPVNSINILMGQPGTGKTIFAEQLVFANASDDRPIVYLTTLSEPLTKMVSYLQRFAFFDEMKIGSSVLYEDIAPQLLENGIGALPQCVQQTIDKSGPKILVIDSFKSLQDLSPSASELRRVLYEVAGLLSAYETTVFLIGEYTDEDARRLPEFAIADGIVQFMRNPLSTRDERFLRVLKLRGSSYLEGLHAFRITAAGLDIFPRLVSPAIPERYTIAEERTTTGINGLDQLMGGGLWRGSTTVLAGPTGSGKTTAALQFVLEGVRRDEPGLYANFQENPMQLARSLRGLGADVDEVKRRGLRFLYASPVELQVDSIIVTLFREIEKSGVRRVVIDSVGDLLRAASDAQRLHDFLYALAQHFTVKGVTTILTYETIGARNDGLNEAAGGRFAFMCDNIVRLSNDTTGKMKRSIAVVKQRASTHDLGIHELEITDEGVRVR